MPENVHVWLYQRIPWLKNCNRGNFQAISNLSFAWLSEWHITNIASHFTSQAICTHYAQPTNKTTTQLAIALIRSQPAKADFTHRMRRRPHFLVLTRLLARPHPLPPARLVRCLVSSPLTCLPLERSLGGASLTPCAGCWTCCRRWSYHLGAVGVHFYPAQQHWSMHRTVGVVIFYQIAPPERVDVFCDWINLYRRTRESLRRSIGCDCHAATPRARGARSHPSLNCGVGFFYYILLPCVCIDRSRWSV
jgi:hypothetical protein